MSIIGACRIKLQLRVDRENSIQPGVVGRRTVCGAILQNHRPLLWVRKQCRVVGDVALNVPGVGGIAQWLGRSSEIDVRVGDIHRRRSIELNSGVLTEIDIEHNFTVRSGAMTCGNKLKILVGLKEKAE